MADRDAESRGAQVVAGYLQQQVPRAVEVSKPARFLDVRIQHLLAAHLVPTAGPGQQLAVRFPQAEDGAQHLLGAAA